IVEGGELAVLGAVALAGDEDAQQQFARDVETLFNNVNTALGQSPDSAPTVDTEYFINGLITLKNKEQALAGTGDYEAYNQIAQQRDELMSGLPFESKMEITGAVNEFISATNNYNSPEKNGFQAKGNEPSAGNMDNPVSNVPATGNYINISPETIDASSVTEVTDSISSDTETVVQDEFSGANVQLSIDSSLKYIPPPKEIDGINGLKSAKPKTAIQGGGGLRKRWKDKKGNIYEWDSQHGTVEKYNKQGKHLGEFDPNTGE
ncbi:colicin E3/pyocin S6 family cytotoxin, partial [Alteromonas ponticola]|uniref:colicin E3/pyocin S6 family cytotoxin n=1 Tax=Alteromonas ponticola TaxID=2720613 RepID=UPI002484129A